MDDHGLSQFQYEKEDFNLKLKKGVDLDEIQNLLGSLGSGPAPVAPIAAPAPVPAARIVIARRLPATDVELVPVTFPAVFVSRSAR